MVDKRPIGEVAGKSDYLLKKIPKNPKYSNVGPTVKTGFHANHIEVVSDQKISKRKGELFRRIKPSTLMSLLKQDKNQESIYNLAENENPDYYDNPSETQSVYSSYTSKTGATEATKMSSITSATEQLVLSDNSEFLLLDLREPEEFDSFHIKESVNYPAPNLGRDKVIPELYKFKNKEDKLIIVYHLDERTSIPFANQFCQKGYDNIYLLTGGVEAFLEKCPQLIEGKKVPTQNVMPEKKNKVLYKRSKHIGNPEEGDVIIPSTHLEDDSRSALTSTTRTSKMTNTGKPNTQTTQTTLNKNASRVSPTTRVFK